MPFSAGYPRGVDDLPRFLYDVPMRPCNTHVPVAVRGAFLLAACLLLCLTLWPPLPARAAEKALFLTVIDGDSLRVEMNGRSIEVRLIGIDAPEGGQQYGTEARTRAMRICYGRDLTLEFDTERTDRYGRTLAYVYCGKVLLNEEMVRAGLAIAIAVKPNTAHFERFKRAEAEARAARRGFWAEGGLTMTPAQWRALHHH
jgi:micrococcal nuclease